MFLKEKLEKRERMGNMRFSTIVENMVDFSSNDYLGLSRRQPSLKALTTGSTGSRLLTGNSLLAEQLEEKIASFHGYESGTLFNCGYMANLGLLSAITSPLDTIFYDSYIHASFHDGIKLSCAQAYPFRHNHLNHLEMRLQQERKQGEAFVCIESIYSTDGSFAPLNDILSLSEKYGAHLIVDEAHAVGIFGNQGRGLSPPAFAKVVTFGKAIGAQGAIILGSHLLKKTLINFARSYIYTTALPMQNLINIQESYELFPSMEKERIHLNHLIHRMSTLTGSLSPIQPIHIPGNVSVLAKSLQLKEMGLDVRALMSPTVRRGQEMLRVCLHSYNTFEELDMLMKVLT